MTNSTLRTDYADDRSGFTASSVTRRLWLAMQYCFEGVFNRQARSFWSLPDIRPTYTQDHDRSDVARSLVQRSEPSGAVVFILCDLLMECKYTYHYPTLSRCLFPSLRDWNGCDGYRTSVREPLIIREAELIRTCRRNDLISYRKGRVLY